MNRFGFANLFERFENIYRNQRHLIDSSEFDVLRVCLVHYATAKNHSKHLLPGREIYGIHIRVVARAWQRDDDAFHAYGCRSHMKPDAVRKRNDKLNRKICLH